MNEPPVIVGIGEVLWDVYPDAARFGGAPANFACHAAALGAEAWMVSAVRRLRNEHWNTDGSMLPTSSRWMWRSGPALNNS